MGNSFSDEKKGKFVAALLILSMKHAGELMQDPTAITETSADEFSQKLYSELHGLTADEVIAKAEALKK